MKKLLGLLLTLTLASGCLHPIPDYPDFPEPTTAGRKVRLLQDAQGCKAVADVSMLGTTGTNIDTLETALREKTVQAGGNALLIKEFRPGKFMVTRGIAQGQAFLCPD